MSNEINSYSAQQENANIGAALVFIGSFFVAIIVLSSAFYFSANNSVQHRENDQSAHIVE